MSPHPFARLRSLPSPLVWRPPFSFPVAAFSGAWCSTATSSWQTRMSQLRSRKRRAARRALPPSGSCLLPWDMVFRIGLSRHHRRKPVAERGRAAAQAAGVLVSAALTCYFLAFSTPRRLRSAWQRTEQANDLTNVASLDPVERGRRAPDDLTFAGTRSVGNAVTLVAIRDVPHAPDLTVRSASDPALIGLRIRPAGSLRPRQPDADAGLDGDDRVRAGSGRARPLVRGAGAGGAGRDVGQHLGRRAGRAAPRVAVPRRRSAAAGAARQLCRHGPRSRPPHRGCARTGAARGRSTPARSRVADEPDARQHQGLRDVRARRARAHRHVAPRRAARVRLHERRDDRSTRRAAVQHDGARVCRAARAVPRSGIP